MEQQTNGLCRLTDAGAGAQEQKQICASPESRVDLYHRDESFENERSNAIWIEKRLATLSLQNLMQTSTCWRQSLSLSFSISRQQHTKQISLHPPKNLKKICHQSTPKKSLKIVDFVCVSKMVNGAINCVGSTTTHLGLMSCFAPSIPPEDLLKAADFAPVRRAIEPRVVWQCHHVLRAHSVSTQKETTVSLWGYILITTTYQKKHFDNH